MCGFFLVAQRGSVDADNFKKSVEFIKHRGPDDAGTEMIRFEFGAENVSVAIAHQRLAIIDTTSSSRQPFRIRARTLAYNGEIYNFRSLREHLVSTTNASFNTEGDTEVLAHLLRLDGPMALKNAEGFWSFIEVDDQSGEIVAARDRLGKKPLFYHISKKLILLSSRVDAIAAYLGAKPLMSVANIDSYIKFGWLFPVSADPGATPFQDIRQVMAGGFLKIDLRLWRVVSGNYQSALDGGDYFQGPATSLIDDLQKSILERLVSDRPVGLLLSGGVDSSLILAALAAVGAHEHIRCFIGDSGQCDDAAFGRTAAGTFGAKPIIVPLDYGGTSRGIDWFIDICRHQEKPFPLIGNVLGLSQLYEAIRQEGVPVVIDGTGADEIFAGYWGRHYRFAIADAARAGDDEWIRQALGSNSDHPRLNEIGTSSFIAGEFGNWQPTTTSGAIRADVVAKDISAFCVPDVASAVTTDRLPQMQGTLRDALNFEITDGLLPEWLWQNDRSAMRAGIENRSPYLSRRMMKYASTGYKTKFVGMWNKHELRNSFGPQSVTPSQWRREKQGFRWGNRAFMCSNKMDILEVIRASQLLPSRVNVGRLIEAIFDDDRLLLSDLTQRCLCLAAMESATGLGTH